MGRYEELFARLRSRNEGAFVPFVMLGDPDLETSRKILAALIAGGADALELGVPFSDPVADGPTIQRAHVRAGTAGVSFSDCMQLVAEVRAAHPDLPIGMLIYGNVPFSLGLDTFYERVHAAGADSVLLPDIPVRESEKFLAAAKKAGVQQVFIAPPGASDATLRAVANHSQGYVYLLSRKGVTGTESVAGTSHIHRITEKLREFGAPPAVLGFGISQPEHVAAALKQGAVGAISGSAIVKEIEADPHGGEALCERIRTFVAQMKAATRSL